MQKARELSWHNGNLLWGLGSEHQNGAIDQMDLVVLSLGQFIKAPKSKIIDYMLSFIARFEDMCMDWQFLNTLQKMCCHSFNIRQY